MIRYTVDHKLYRDNGGSRICIVIWKWQQRSAMVQQCIYISSPYISIPFILHIQ